MKIGITTRILTSNTNVKLNAIPITYLNIIKEKYYPVIIDSTIDLKMHKNELLNQIKDIDAFILPGGDSINEVDLFIIDYCYKNNTPLLGICLGMQEIAYYFDNNTVEKLNTLNHFDMNAKYLHEIKIDTNSYFYKILKKNTIKVNSRHKYHIKNNKNFEVLAKSNNVIEAIKVKNTKYILGVQFHPEIMYEYDDNAKKIFSDFFSIIDNN